MKNITLLTLVTLLLVSCKKDPLADSAPDNKAYLEVSTGSGKYVFSIEDETKQNFTCVKSNLDDKIVYSIYALDWLKDKKTFTLSWNMGVDALPTGTYNVMLSDFPANATNLASYPADKSFTDNQVSIVITKELNTTSTGGFISGTFKGVSLSGKFTDLPFVKY